MSDAILITAYAVVAVVLLWTSWIDIKTREVPDWLSGSLLILGLVFAMLMDYDATSAVTKAGADASHLQAGIWVAALIAALFIALWFIDGFVFVPRPDEDAQPWWAQVATSVGICLAAGAASLALYELAPSVARTLAGAALGYLIGVVLYWSKQWGGGDAKLLAAVGAVLGFDIPWIARALNAQFNPAPSFAWFLGFLLIGGAVYGAAWLLVLAITRRKEFAPTYKTSLKQMRIARISVWVATLIVLLAALYAGTTLGWLFGILFIVLAALIFGGFYLVVAVKAAETSLMIVTRKPSQLVEGDWVLGPVVVKGKTIIPKSSAGASMREIAMLRKAAPSMIVRIRQGVPFVPSFLIAFAALVVLRWVIFA